MFTDTCHDTYGELHGTPFMYSTKTCRERATPVCFLLLLLEITSLVLFCVILLALICTSIIPGIVEVTICY